MHGSCSESLSFPRFVTDCIVICKGAECNQKHIFEWRTDLCRITRNFWSCAAVQVPRYLSQAELYPLLFQLLKHAHPAEKLTVSDRKVSILKGSCWVCSHVGMGLLHQCIEFKPRRGNCTIYSDPWSFHFTPFTSMLSPIACVPKKHEIVKTWRTHRFPWQRVPKVSHISVKNLCPISNLNLFDFSF